MDRSYEMANNPGFPECERCHLAKTVEIKTHGNIPTFWERRLLKKMGFQFNRSGHQVDIGCARTGFLGHRITMTLTEFYSTHKTGSPDHEIQISEVSTKDITPLCPAKNSGH